MPDLHIKSKSAETPLMQQYNRIKAKHPDAVLLFRVGDFYETFGEDAIKTSKILGIVLTKRQNGAASHVELAGFPHHALDTYLPKLVKAGQRVAICDQLEDPKLTKTIVKRGVTELVTPGVAFNDRILDQKSNNFLASIYWDKKSGGIAFLDVSTGEFLVAEGSIEYLDKLIQNFKPSEILFQKERQKNFIELFGDKHYTYGLDEWIYKADYANELLLKHFSTLSLKGFGIENLSLGIIAASAALHYLGETKQNNVRHISKISRIEEDHYVWLDPFTVRNLELLYSPNENAGTLLNIVDHTCSPMGARLMKRWVALPLKDIQPIEERLSVVEYFIQQKEIADHALAAFSQMGDLERLVSKIAVGRVNPREVLHLRNALSQIEPLKNICEESGNTFLKKTAEQLNPCLWIQEKIAKELKSDLPLQINRGGVMAEGVSKELDDLRSIAYSGKDYLLQLQQSESEKTGISSLKINFNNVFGYYIEVRNTHKEKVPSDWIRKQTLANAERYITEELKEYEEKILGAEDKILALEQKLFNDLLLSLADYIQPIQLNAALIARLDCLLSFAAVSEKFNYTKPQINDSFILNIKNSRHPVIEQHLPLGEKYITNDVYLDDQLQQIIMITGPNMSGKSALLRQTALIVIMAQMGCFVPAGFASIGLVDKIFTRVGASDNISSGESTFMVEMNETASILNNLSNRSLVLLDEIGRGTSTYDGISIAWAIAEYIHDHSSAKAKTLFATHYHELNEMESRFRRIRNYNVSVKEIDNKVIFLRKLVAGGSNHSFGIHVAKLAGMPGKVIKRSNEILQQLEKSHSDTFAAKTAKLSKADDDIQLSIFQLNDPVLTEIKEELLKTDINTLTPIEALMKLNEIKKMVGG
jgi:DNA mismatch repair protein MutS